jgi:hypothetical protein
LLRTEFILKKLETFTKNFIVNNSFVDSLIVRKSNYLNKILFNYQKLDFSHKNQNFFTYYTDWIYFGINLIFILNKNRHSERIIQFYKYDLKLPFF